MKSGEFRAEDAPYNPRISDMANCVIQFAYLAEGLALEKRSNVGHINGEQENVAEHSNMLAIIAPVLAEKFYSDLDGNLIARYASIHDAVEAYVGDTPTHNFSEVDHTEKELKEAEGLAVMRSVYAAYPSFLELVDQYEAQEIPEARFVRVVDKIMPLTSHFPSNGKFLQAYTTSEKLKNHSSARNDYLRAKYPEFKKLVDLREKLIQYAAEVLFED
jgi:5'-deoxynucleotidase YfbR-like HD superfamily hydrolase